MNLISVRRWCTVLTALALAVSAGLAAPPAPARAAVACQVVYTETGWSGGYVGNARIRNTGDLPWNSILIEFTLGPNDRLGAIWNYNVQVLGQNVRAQSTAAVAPVPPGGTTEFGFVGQYTGTHVPPSNWRVNGVPCSGAGQPPAVIAEPESRSVPEGTSAPFTVRLSHPPAGPVGLRITTSGTGIWAMPPIAISFNPSDWSTPKSLSVYSPQDADAVDDVAVFTLSVPGYLSDTVTFTQLDDD
ncbi:cellulose binding domain-containing protein [Plantactinospora endophytica]|uniref:CBM2 domain-containing protein n=1 Tax=Plantactinospora endophytica TaxID=673535 RepID=A0ABQ4DU48_9ACTN|nr:cellulose binding domain-containing protein [Plantactinospora endophytica]GIG85971.1 hypothetical protein Pen02_09070 [Plantactinospora endophytica]